MAVTTWLIDKSALVRLAHNPDAELLGQPDWTRAGPHHHVDAA
jgi:hypothetical protein